MATLIKNRSIAADPWLTLSFSQPDSEPDLPAGASVIVPLGVWLQHRAALLTRQGEIGVWLDSHEDPALIAEDLAHFTVIAVNFPKFTDGRGYSIGRLLRERYGYAGELRAIGEVLRDQLFELAQCGFDAFALRADQDAASALQAFQDFSDSYQATAAQPLPLFRRRAA